MSLHQKIARAEAVPTARQARRDLSSLVEASFPCPVPYRFRSSAIPWLIVTRLLSKRLIVFAPAA
jgi:hypothetical protein